MTSPTPAVSDTVKVSRRVLEAMLRRSLAPFSKSIPDYDAQVAALFDSNRYIENKLASLLGKEPKRG